MNLRRVLSLMCVGLGVTMSFAAEAGLPDGVALPPGMSMEQAKATAQSQGITTRAQAEQTARERGMNVPATNAPATSAAPKVVTDKAGDIDPNEGEVLTDEEREKKLKATQKGMGGGASAGEGMRYGQAIFRNANPSLFASHVGAVNSNYQLGPGDQIILTLWGQKEARYELTLDRSGQVQVEGVGLVSLSGMSLKDAQAFLYKRLTRIYAGMTTGQTNMDLTLGKIRQIRVFINGDVVSPGSYMLSGNTNVFNALYQAKGPSSLGSERKIEIVRGSARFEVDLYAYLFRDVRQARDILQDGDIIRVPVRGPVVSIQGEIGRPGRYELLPNESTKELFQYCGGIKITTATHKVVATRIFENGRREAIALPAATELAMGKSTVKLKDGDELFVYQGNDPSKQTVSIEGEVRFPGAYPWKEGMTASDLIQQAGGYTHRIYSGRALLTRGKADGNQSILALRVVPEATDLIFPGDRVTFLNRFEMTKGKGVTISGAVARPGNYSLDSGLTLRNLVLLAGGFVKEADPKRTRIESPLDSAQGSNVEFMALDTSLSLGASDRSLTDGMHIAIPYTLYPKTLEMVQVNGMVAFPGSYSLKNHEVRISAILSQAGGLRIEAYPAGAQLVRPNVGRISINVARALAQPGGLDDIVLRGGDVLDIPLVPATVRVSGMVYNAGNIPWRQGKKWNWYVSMAGGIADSANEDKIYLRLADGSIQTREYGIDSLPNPGSEIIVPFKVPSEPVKFTDVIAALGSVATVVLTAITIFILVNKS